MNLSTLTDRRAFLKTTALASASLAAGLGALAQNGAARPAKRNIKLGLDNFAVRAMGWKAPQPGARLGREDCRREPRRRYAGLGTRHAHRGGGQGLCRRQPRFGQRGLDAGGSTRES